MLASSAEIWTLIGGLEGLERDLKVLLRQASEELASEQRRWSVPRKPQSRGDGNSMSGDFKTLDDILPEGAVVLNQVAVVSYMRPDGSQSLVVARGEAGADEVIAMLEKAKLSVFLGTYFVSDLGDEEV